MFILINMPCWDSQCSTMECANITHSLIGLYLAGNVCKVDIQCLLKECVNVFTSINPICKVIFGIQACRLWVLGEAPAFPSFGRNRTNSIPSQASPYFGGQASPTFKSNLWAQKYYRRRSLLWRLFTLLNLEKFTKVHLFPP